MGFRIRIGPVSVGTRSAGVSVGPLSANASYRGRTPQSGKPGSNGPIGMFILIAAFWQFTFPHFLNKQFREESILPSKTMNGISALLTLSYPAMICYLLYFQGESPSFLMAVISILLLNVLSAFPGLIIYGIAFEIIKSLNASRIRRSARTP